MRIVKEILNPACRITIFQWNQKYIVKLEQDNLEQTYKIDEYEVVNEESIENMLTEEFIQKSVNLFRNMSESLNQAIDNA